MGCFSWIIGGGIGALIGWATGWNQTGCIVAGAIAVTITGIIADVCWGLWEQYEEDEAEARRERRG